MSHTAKVDWKRLRAVALESRNNAYAPYSKFHVGAALLCSDDTVFSGVNVENASFGLTICAERSAILAAVSDGQQNFTALAVAADSETVTAPCGACLQVMAEFVDAEFPVLLLNTRDESELETSLGKLLPMANQGLGNLRK